MNDAHDSLGRMIKNKASKKESKKARKKLACLLSKEIQNLRSPMFSLFKNRTYYYSTYSTYNVETIFQQNRKSAHKIGLHVPDDYDQHSVSNVAIFNSDVTNTVHYNAE